MPREYSLSFRPPGSPAAGEPVVEARLCERQIPKDPETRRALKDLIQAAARVLVSRPASERAAQASTNSRVFTKN